MFELRCWAGLALLTLGAGSVQAKDTHPCPAGDVCASQPATVVAAIQQAGYKAVLGPSDNGGQVIRSSASGYDFDIHLIDCEGQAQCGALQFTLVFNPYENHNAALANQWNIDKRLMKAEAMPDHRLSFIYDLSTTGGLNQVNFADVVGWWASQVGEVDSFFRDHPPGKALP